MTEDEILSIQKAGDLFSNDREKCKAEYKELVKIWHPDVSGSLKAREVFDKITELYQQAQDYFLNDIWEKQNEIIFYTNQGKKVIMNYLERFSFGLGECYICNNYIIYLFQKEKEKYYRNAIDQIEHLAYADKKMETEFKRFLPQIYNQYQTTKGLYGLVLKKEEGVYPLKNILTYFKNRIPHKQAAWMISRLHNLACYFSYNHLVHNDITLENCFISPEEHTIYLYGGFWYTTKAEEKMLGISKEIYEIMPVRAKNTKSSEYTTDLEAIKLLGRKLLGEVNSRKLAAYYEVPKPFLEFLIRGADTDSFKQLTEWEEVLKKSYGKRKFIEMKIKREDIYQK